MAQTLAKTLLWAGGDHASDELETVAGKFEGDLWKESLVKRRRRIRLSVALALVAVAAGAILGPFMIELALVVSVLGMALAFYVYRTAQSIRPAKRVISVTRLHWLALVRRYGDKVVFYDLSGALPSVELDTQTDATVAGISKIRDRLAELPEKLDLLEAADVFTTVSKTELFGVEAEISRCLDQLGEVIELPARPGERIPVIYDGSILDALLSGDDRFVEKDPAGVVGGDFERSLASFHEELMALQSVDSAEQSVKLDELLAEVETYCDLALAKLRAARLSSVEVIRELHNLATHTTSRPGLSVYCEQCFDEAREEGATAPKLPQGAMGSQTPMQCPSCGSELTTKGGIVLSRVFDEVFLPLHDRLLSALDQDSSSLPGVAGEPRKLEAELKKDLETVRMDLESRARRCDEQRNALRSLEERIGSTTSMLRNHGRVDEAGVSSVTREVDRLRNRVETALERLTGDLEIRLDKDWMEASGASSLKRSDWLRKQMLTSLRSSASAGVESPAGLTEVSEVGLVSSLSPSALPRAYEAQNRARHASSDGSS